jgi:hypothetical protein
MEDFLSPNSNVADSLLSESSSSKASPNANDEAPPLGMLQVSASSEPESSEDEESSQNAENATPPDTVQSPSPSSSDFMPTPISSSLFGELLDLLAKPLESPKEALIFLAGAQLGLFYETLAFVAVHVVQKRSGTSILSSSRNQPPYEDENANDFQRYSGLLANLSAFMYWDYSFNYYWKLRDAKAAFRKYTIARQQNISSNLTEWNSNMEQEHTSWCESAGVDATAVKEVSDIMEACIQAVFQVRFASAAEWMQSNKPFPLWKRTNLWRGKMQRGESKESRRDNMLSRVYGIEAASRLCDALCALMGGEGDTQAALMHALEVNEEEWKPCEVETEQKRPSTHRLMSIQKRVQNTRIGSTVEIAGRRVQTWSSNRKERRENRSNAVKGKKNGSNGEFEFDLENDHGVGAEEEKSDDILEIESEFHTIAPVMYSLRVGSEGNGFSWCCDNARTLMAIGHDLNWINELCARGNAPHIVATRHKNYQPPSAGLMTGRGIGRRPRKPIVVKGVWPAELHTHHRLKSLCAVKELQHVVWKVPNTLTQGGKQSMIKIFLSISSLLDQAMLENLQDSFIYLESIQLGLWMNEDDFSHWSVLPAAHLSGWNLVGWSLYDDSCSTPKQKEIGDQHFFVFQYDAGCS